MKISTYALMTFFASVGSGVRASGPLTHSVYVYLPGTDRTLSLTEVEVFADIGGESINVARKGGANATQINTYLDSTIKFGAGNAIDGVTSYPLDPSDIGDLITHTWISTDAWWKVDLDTGYEVNQVVLYNRVECCWERLSGAIVHLLDSNGGIISVKSIGVVSSDAPTTSNNLPLSFSLDFPTQATASAPLAKAVYVYIPGEDKILHLLEVQVFADIDGESINVARKGGAQATQINTYLDNTNLFGAGKAIDGVTSYTNGDQEGFYFETKTSSNPWWKVDLDDGYAVSQVVLYNRFGDWDGLALRLSGAIVLLLDSSGEIIANSEQSIGIVADNTPSFTLDYTSIIYDTESPTPAPTGTPTSSPTQAPTGTPTSSPTQAPIGAPTSSPTQAPTGTPTSSPTRRPTDSPSLTPWEIVLPNPDVDEDVVVDFSKGSGASSLPTGVAAGDEGVITTKYSATATDASAELETFMVKGACDASSSGGETRIPSAGTCDATASPLATVCTYRFEKTGFDAAFNLDTTGTKPILRMCEVARLELPRAESDALVIKEYFTNVEVEFNTTASFNVTSIALEKATIAENTQQTSLSDYITASDCSVLVNEKLPPNTPLCVRISSSSTAVKIEKITDMTITGVGATATNSAPLTVVKSDGLAQYSAITSITDYNQEDITIRTRIPTNQFDFEAEDAAIKIAGSVVVKFAERRLKVDIDRLLQTANEEETASFDINVNLASEPDLALEGGEEAMMNSANDAAASKAFAILGMVFASAFALW